MASESSPADTNVARALDLTRAVTDILNRSGAIGGLVGNVIKWLAREGIAEGEFAYCMEKSKALMYPNDKGLEIRSRLRQSDAKLKAKPYIAGLRLVSALSIGRWMVDDPDYCYLVTTVAALFAQHDMSYAAEVVCDMLLDEGNHDGGISKVYRYEKSRLRPVVKKIVESITLNVVNCSANFDYLPEEVRGSCSHQIDSHIFAAAAMAISRGSGDVVIRCNRFLADLYVWLLAHIEGDVSLSIAGRIVHRATFGRPLRSVTMLADEACTDDHAKIASTLVISMNVGGTLRTMLRHTADHARFCGSCAKVRQPLYDLHVLNRSGRSGAILTRQELREIRIAGRRIVKWLMAQPVRADHDSQIVYSTTLHNTRSSFSCCLTVGMLLSRWPAIMNLDHSTRTSGHSFPNPDHLDQCDYDGATTMPVRRILNCFSHARTIIAHACTRCRCTCCRNEMSAGDKNYEIVSKPGCLAYLAEDYLLLIIAHAVADGFGIPDASTLSDFSAIRNGVQKLMSQVISHSHIAWETWFSLAACTYLGCEWAGTKADADEKLGELVAIQHGSAVVVAPWINICNELSLQGSFGCSIAAGQLSGMNTDFGVLYTEMTSPAADPSSDEDIARVQLMHEKDITLQSAIAGVSGSTFRLMTIATAGDYLRIINPATASMALERSVQPKCDHKQTVRMLYEHLVHDMHGLPGIQGMKRCQQWEVEDALGLWSNDFDFAGEANPKIESSKIHCSLIYSDPVKLNILLALSPHGCVLKQDYCCLECAKTWVWATGITSAPTASKRIICVMKPSPKILSQTSSSRFLRTE